jgi:hypothetical protein
MPISTRFLGFEVASWVIVAASCALVAACGGDDEPKSNAGGGSAGAAGSSANAGSGGAGSAISRAACEAYCSHYGTACSKPTSICAQYCDLAQMAVPSSCAAPFNAYMECSASATLDCGEDLGNTPVDGCGRDAVESCITGGGCSRFSSIDNLCAKDHADLVGYLCTGKDDVGCVPLDASDTASRSRCCPAR